MCKIVHVLVCYYNEKEIEHFIEKEIMSQKTQPSKIIVVDNGSNEPNVLLMLEKKFVGVTILDYKKNLGYWGAFKKAIDEIGATYKYEYIILSNSDITFTDKYFYNILCENQSLQKQDIGIIAPKISSSNSHENLNPYMINRPSLKKLKLLKSIYSNEIFALIYNLLHVIKHKFSFLSDNDKEVEEKNYIYAPHGSFMIFEQKFISQLSFSYDAFLFGEEIFVGEACQHQKLKTVYLPELSLIHNEHTTTGWFQKGILLKYKMESLGFLIDFLSKRDEEYK